MKENEKILEHVEAIGGSYVWDAEIFAVTLLDVPAKDGDLTPLSHLRGVQQIALNASNLSFGAIESIARIPGLESLVLCQHNLSSEELVALRLAGPEIEVVSNEA